MKILCICKEGNSRSVGLTYMLKNLGHDAIAIGVFKATPETQKMLFEWAEVIIMTVAKYKDMIPAEYSAKLKIYDVGKDRYFLGYKQELLDQYENYLKTDPL